MVGATVVVVGATVDVVGATVVVVCATVAVLSATVVVVVGFMRFASAGLIRINGNANAAMARPTASRRRFADVRL